LIKSASGLPVLAHPADIEGIDNLIIELKDAGLVGLEAYCGKYDAATVERFVSLAGEHGLLTTGGSDYHHFLDGKEVPMGSVDIPEDSIRKLFQAAGRPDDYIKE
jgi:predicted metal-dependent phosphoesterase TrpH